uniref:Uncharacterized protein n=1 Tax=Arundo donax TaxID=35708 RepID=A0A0A8Z639_ARUDO
MFRKENKVQEPLFATRNYEGQMGLVYSCA